MKRDNAEVLIIRKEQELSLMRSMVQRACKEIGMSVLNQTKLITAASELARNMLLYARGGKMTLTILPKSGKRVVQLIFEDKGPGMADAEKAMQKGYSSRVNGLGLGLPGTKRLVDYFSLETKVGEGTTVIIEKS
ncbi:anti-sigma regulatory factor [Roseivirga sp. BDSF3-8]|uniref:anti-sigma regulatory factor n=1 Tax=Roseivirga sp. BDSF3-8 TaxID=3241598 RepID=UPI003531BAB6